MHIPKPEWLRIKLQSSKEQGAVKEILQRLSLNTVCQEANCPNKMECYGRKTATFIILGRNCTRNCTFCNVEKNAVQPVDADEPIHVAQAVEEMGLEHVVITSVTRDDLPDGGAGHFVSVVENIRKLDAGVTVEVLIPDFKGDKDALAKVVRVKPDVINHNIETIKRLYPTVRPMAVYERSLRLLAEVKEMGGSIQTKSGIMVGLGETEEEVLEVFRDLREVSCDILTVGQYLAPSKKHHPVVEYVHPDVFEKYKEAALGMGFTHVSSGPLVRSSYHAEKAICR